MFHQRLNGKQESERGQGLVEYAMILVLVAVVVIVVLALIGPAVGNIFSQVNNALKGNVASGQLCKEFNAMNLNGFSGPARVCLNGNMTGATVRLDTSAQIETQIFYYTNPGSCPAGMSGPTNFPVLGISAGINEFQDIGLTGAPTYYCYRYP